MEKIELSSASISMDEGNLFYSGVFSLHSYLDRGKFKVDTSFVFDMYGETYNFIVDSITFAKPEVDPEFSLTVVLNCISPSAVLAAPRARPITKVWPTTTAQSIASEVLGGYPMSWEILDWPITNSLFSVTDQTPLDIVKTLVATVGAVVESVPDGSLVVRYKFPVSVPFYGPSTADHTFSEADEMIAGNEGYVSRQTFNKFRLLDSQGAKGADRLEFEEPTGGIGRGIVRAYPNPWRTTFNLLSTRSGVWIGPQEYEEREETQTIEIVNGKGTVQYPILSVVSIDFLDTDLTGVSTTPDSTNVETTSTTQLYSLLQITYKVRSLKYEVVGEAGDQAQFLMEDL